MCVIVYKPAGKRLPSKETLRQCFLTNSDGAGFSYHNENGETITRKGFFSFKKLWRAVRDIPENTDIVLHFRIATHGTIEKRTCHPFMTSQGYAIAHNGIISGYGDKTKSDTMDFIETIVDNITSRDDVARVLTATAKKTGSKFALMDSDGVELFGQFTEIDGVYFSNTYWRNTFELTTKTWRDYYYYYDYEPEPETKETARACACCGSREDVSPVVCDGVTFELCGDCRDFLSVDDENIERNQKGA